CFDGCARWREARHAGPPAPPRGSPPVGVASSAGEFGVTRTPSEQPSVLQAGHLLVGDGWGCAGFFGPSTVGWQCWRAAAVDGAPPPEVIAERIRWLPRDASAGSDRICATA